MATLLLLPQAFRMFFGAGFIVEAVFGIIPIGYGTIDGLLHITTAFLATTLAIYVARGISFFILGDIGTDHNVFYAAPIFIGLHLISLYKVYLESKNIENT